MPRYVRLGWSKFEEHLADTHIGRILPNDRMRRTVKPTLVRAVCVRVCARALTAFIQRTHFPIVVVGFTELLAARR